MQAISEKDMKKIRKLVKRNGYKLHEIHMYPREVKTNGK